MIIVKNRELLIPETERYIGTTYDTESEVRQFALQRFAQNGVDLSALTFHLDLKYANDETDTVLLGKEVNESNIILTWTVTSAVLQVPGTLFIQLRGADDEVTVKWSSFHAAIYVERHLNTPGTYTGDLTEIEQMEQDHQYMLGVVNELKANIDYAHDAEAWAVGKRSGTDVPSTDEAYHNNSKYYKELSDGHRQTSERFAKGTVNGSDVSSGDGYHDNSKYYKELADDHRKTAEAYAKGTVNGTAVTSGQTGYQDNAKYYKEQVQSRLNQIDTNTSNIAVQTARIDNIAQLPSGSTSGDAELMDIRVGADGVTYTSAGAAVRANDSALKSQIVNNNSFDVFDGLLAKSSGTSNGVTYTWNGDVCTANGTASNSSVNILVASSALPSTVIPGKTYLAKYSTTDINVRLRVIWRTSDGTDISTMYATGDREMTVPDNAAKWTVALFVSKDKVINNAVVSEITFLTAKSNLELQTDILTAYTLANRGVLPDSTDLNSVTTDGRYACSTTYTYSNAPVSGGGVLEVLNVSESVKVQRFTSFTDKRTYVRLTGTGTFSSATVWVPIALQNEALPHQGSVARDTDIDTVKEQGIWLLNSNYNYTHSPFASTDGAVLLVFKYNDNFIVQLASRCASVNSNNTYIRTSLAGAFNPTWTQLHGSDTVINNTYVTENYENTYNITCEPTITTDTNNYLASTGDTTDRTGDIQTMLNTTGVCHLGPGVFYTTGIEVPSYATLDGCGTATMVRLLASVTTGYAIKLKSEGRVSNMRISGGTSAPTLSATVGTRHGILFEGTKVSGESGGTTYKRSSIDHVLVRYFEGGGITCTGTGVDLDSNLLISDCFVDHCGAGLYIPYYSEFHRICNCAFTYNWYGVVDNGGNNNFANCDFSGNRIGILIDNSSSQSPNNAHGTFSSCSVNHSYTDEGVINGGTAIKILGASIAGEIFTGMQIFYGAIVIDRSTGIRFIGANVGSKVPITITDSKVITFSDCTFKETWASGDSVVTQSGNTVLKFTDCYLRSGTAYDPMA